MTTTAATDTPEPSAASRVDYGPIQAAEATGIGRYLFELGRAAGVIPGPDTPSGRWSATVVEQLRADLSELMPRLDDLRALGAVRIAEALTKATGIEGVRVSDVEELAERGLLRRMGEFNDRPLYAARDAETFTATDVLTEIVAERLAWFEASFSLRAAAERCGWREDEFTWAAEQGSKPAGRFGRWAADDVEALAADEALGEEVEGRRLLTGQEAADLLDITYQRDFPYLEAAGWLEPASTHFKQVGSVRYVGVKLYRTSDLWTVRDMPDIDWEAVRAVPKGRTSALRQYATRATKRSDLVRKLAGILADRHQAVVHLLYDNADDDWSAAWEHPEQLKLTRVLLTEAAGEDSALAKVAAGISLRSRRLRTVLTARRMSTKGVAAVIDTETTDLFGRVCEVAAIDAHTGRVLINTLVNPGVPNRATHIHGITDAMVADAPTWEEVLPKLRRALAGRALLAYNSEYDRSVITGHTESIGRSPGRLADSKNWWCLMEARSAWGRHRRYHLGGGHRALGDCEAARDILAWVAEGRGVITVTPESSGASA